MKAKIKYSLSRLDYCPICEIEVFEDSSDKRIWGDLAVGETFVEAREQVLKSVRDRLLERRDPPLEIPPSEEIEL